MPIFTPKKIVSIHIIDSVNISDHLYLINTWEFQIKENKFDTNWSNTLRKIIMESRLKLPFQESFLEFDDYIDRNLLVAGVDFPSRKKAKMLPDLGLNITDNPTYKNRNLAR